MAALPSITFTLTASGPRIRDPRTLWVSPDGAIAIVRLEDIPEGVARSSGHGYGPHDAASTPQAAAEHMALRISEYTIGWAIGPKAAAAGNYVAAVHRRNLPWETGAVSTPPANKVSVKDWPIPCPKCARKESAVLLFQTYDCKHGCYK